MHGLAVCELAVTIAVGRKEEGKNEPVLMLFSGTGTILNRIKKGESFTAHVAFPGSINAYSCMKRC